MDAFLTDIDTYLRSSGAMAFLASYLGGILVSFTPCIYPMLPITIGVIGSSNIGGTKIRGMFLSLSYVTGLATSYAALGIFAAATGSLFGALNTSPYTFLLFGNILLLFGLSMLEVFQIPFISVTINTKTKGIGGIFLLGMASALIAGPCTTPVLGSLLAFAGSSNNLVFGGILLFTFSFGMGSVLLLAGTFSGFLAALPKSGAWMVRIKKIIGVIIIGWAEYFFIRAGGMFT